MKSKLYLIFFPLMVTYSCNNSASKTNVELAAKKVVEVFGGYCKYTYKWQVSTAENEKKSIELELSNSSTAEELISFPEMISSGIAYLFYSNLKKPEEQKKYTHIKTIIIFKNGGKFEHEYPIEELAAVDRFMPIAYKISNIIKDKQFDSLRLYLDNTSYITYNIDTFINSVKQVDSEFTKFKGFYPIGYRFQVIDDTATNLHISGIVLRETENSRLSVDIDTTDKSGKAVLINYKF